MSCCSEEKSQLIEEIGVHFEQIHQLAPLAARIYAIMILSPKDGHTFDEILEITSASKSSVSTHLNHLLQLKKIEYFTKSGDRKRYFRASTFYLKNTLEEYHLNISEEIKLMDKIINFNTKNNNQKFQMNGQTALLFREYLESQKLNIENVIQKMSKIKS
ncbi:GbsR/MarR family transcriptional regulator [Zunongwangia endophytica]|uniref:GbsR/MarR family transcriptional regulator n=1 Tax=Zunongwangia endophytica TaxID=1808945 RepID=A0ABV8H5C6_9FLAO|nr:transcriptional regulator [Zunongwangia endophytica]MDN3596079.1 transcriptional regulator [Zunongwangia endophytica]